ncbi:MAG: energy transducer TonB [Vicinamibacterales bacterium]
MKVGVLSIVGVLSLGPVHARAQTQAPRVYTASDGIVMPQVVSDVKPSYAPEAMRARVSGSVKLDCVVKADGTVGEVRVLESLHPALDENSVAALKQWRFKPGTRGGEAVAVRVEVEMAFSTRRNLALDSPEVYIPGAEGVSLPRAVRETKPSYTTAAREARIEGVVTVQAVVRPDGTVGDTRVSGSLDPELDAEALKAIKQWRFEPGRKDGRAVPVQVMVEMRFTLR